MQALIGSFAPLAPLARSGRHTSSSLQSPSLEQAVAQKAVVLPGAFAQVAPAGQASVVRHGLQAWTSSSTPGGANAGLLVVPPRFTSEPHAQSAMAAAAVARIRDGMREAIGRE